MNRRDFLSSRAHHDHHNLTPGLLRALILLFKVSFLLLNVVSPEASYWREAIGTERRLAIKLRKALTNRLCFPTEPLNTNCEYALLRLEWSSRGYLKAYYKHFLSKRKPLPDQWFCPLVHSLQAIKTCWLPGNLSSTDKNLDSYWNFKLRLLIWMQGSARVQRRIPPCNKKTSKLLNPKFPLYLKYWRGDRDS